jgi:hypothetical protein
MKRKFQCVECRFCRTRVDPKKGPRRRCARKPGLSLEGDPRPACREFSFPDVDGHWGA